MPSCRVRQKSSSDQLPIPVATSGVIFGPSSVPNGVSSAAPPANGLPPGTVWQPMQSPATARYRRARSVQMPACLPLTARQLRRSCRPQPPDSSACALSCRYLAGRWLSGLYERARTLQVLVYDRVGGPIGEGAYGIRGIVTGVLREGGGTHDEQVGYVPALQIAVQCAALGFGAHDRAAAGMCRLVHCNVEGARAWLLLELPRPHLLHDLGQAVRQVLRHLEFVLVEIERDPHELAAEPVGISRIEIKIGVAVTAAAAVGDHLVTCQIVLRHRLLPLEPPSRGSLRHPCALERSAVGLHRAQVAATDETMRPV